MASLAHMSRARCLMQIQRFLGRDVYANRLKALTIDEAHCVKKWYVFDSSFFIVPIILLQG